MRDELMNFSIPNRLLVTKFPFILLEESNFYHIRRNLDEKNNEII